MSGNLAEPGSLRAGHPCPHGYGGAFRAASLARRHVAGGAKQMDVARFLVCLTLKLLIEQRPCKAIHTVFVRAGNPPRRARAGYKIAHTRPSTSGFEHIDFGRAFT